MSHGATPAYFQPRASAHHGRHASARSYGVLVGTLFYGGSQTPIKMDDRALAHLKVVIATKLRRSESFTLSWRHPDGQPRGRSTVWLHPSIPLRFVFDDPEPADLSRAWIEELATSANSSGGIMLVAEHLETVPHPAPGADADSAVDTDLATATGDDANADELGVGGLRVGKIAVQELTIEKMTVAGTELAGTAAAPSPAPPAPAPQ